ncbi:hypothetical protein LMJ53_15545 [Rheinheimera sp. UJ51]|uniref:hypothetical protein n=1 Tax=Rheinheimera sp. UJ51 TaxID=2892446 RepID=UPI001E382D36|nr:hypothetical protein [Rheinheimera sp. UJ51]MCC5453134.1 hypothetical protein [Rheinheimera sp. UJ51]
MKICLFIISILYVLLEISFRVRFFEIAGVSTLNPVNFDSAEFIGRLISSLGFAILSFTFAVKRIESKPLIKSVMITICSFFLFFFGQRIFLDLIVANLSDDFKKNAFYVEIKKNNFFNSNEYLREIKAGNPIFDLDSDNSIEDKVFYINFPLSYFNFIKDSKKESFNNEIDIYVDFLFYKNEDYYFNVLSNVEYSYTLLHREYSKIYSSLKSSLKEKQLIDGMIKLKKILDTDSFFEYTEYKNVMDSVYETEPLKNEFYYTRFIGTAELYNLKFKSGSYYLKNNTEYGYGIVEDNDDFFKENISDIKNTFYKEFTKLNTALDFMLVKDEKIHSSLMKELSMISNSVCVEINKNKAMSSERYRNGYSFMRVKSHKKENTLYLKGDGNENYECDVDKSIKNAKAFLKNLYDITNKTVYNIDKPIKSKHEFIKTEHYQKNLRDYLEFKGLKVSKKQLIDITDDTTLQRLYTELVYLKARRSVNHLLNKMHDEKIFNDKNNSNIQYNLSFKDFVNHKEIFNHIKSKYPFFVTGGNEHFYHTKYEHGNKAKEKEVRKPAFIKLRIEAKRDLKELHQKMLNGNFEDERLNEFARAIIVPIFVMFVSTLMLILNLLNLILIFIKNKKIILPLKLSFLLIIFVIPAFIVNGYEKDNNILYENLENKKFTRLIQNVNSVLYLIERPLAESIYVVDYLEYQYLAHLIYLSINSNESHVDKRITERFSELARKLNL